MPCCISPVPVGRSCTPIWDREYCVRIGFKSLIAKMNFNYSY